ncbi:Bacterial extracellular solute-binding protein, family 5 [Candidatus Magnetomorum sp. HK-1]|nr:Bacterial extracellular solute-binding protein, family 5 [Candidatus Magnetomorum sp. HK-1]
MFICPKNNNFLYGIAIISGLISFILFACDSSQLKPGFREKYLSESPEEIVIGIVDSSNIHNQFVEGVKLGIEEINEFGVLGKKIRPVYYDDQASCAKGQAIARKLARNPKVFAVVGHNSSDVAIATSITYEKSGILFISAGATAQDLIQNHYKYIFRNIPSDEQLTLPLIRYAHDNQLKKIIVIFDNDNRMCQLANFFMSEFSKTNGDVVASRSYISWETDFKNIIQEIKAIDHDALFISGNLPSAATFIKQTRNMGINKTILTTNKLDSLMLFQIADQQATDVVVTTFFDPIQPVEETRAFVNHFTKKTRNSPDALSASGYDAIMLLAAAIEKSGSFVPLEIASTLRLFKNWKGAIGHYSMDKNGGTKDKAIFFKKSNGEEFQYIDRDLIGNVNPYEVVKDFTLRIPIEGNIPSIDPGLIDNITSIDIVEQLFLGLTDYDPDTYEPIPEFAKSWTVSADYQKYTFYLKKNIVWTDDKPVTAHDIQWAILRNLKKETQSPYVYSLYVLKNSKNFSEGNINSTEVGINVINDYCISFHLNIPAPYFPSMAGLWVFRPLPRHIIEKYPETWTEPENIISNGSYRLAAWEKGLMMILRKNETYMNEENVLIPEVRYLILSDGKIGMEMFISGEIDIIGGNYLKIPNNYIFDISLNPKYKNQYFQKEVFCSYAFAFNTKNYPVDNVWVRKAINAVIDRERILKYILKDNQEVAYNFTPQLSNNFNNNVFDPISAKKWLTKAGYPSGKDFPEITITYNQSDFHEKMAGAVKDCLDYYLNIKARLNPLKWEKYVESFQSPESWHLIRYGWCADYPDLNNWLNELFHPERSDNVIQWSNNEFLDIMNRVDKTINFTDRINLYSQAEKILCEKACAVVPIYFERSHYLINPRVKGWYHMPLGGQHIRQWELKYNE